VETIFTQPNFRWELRRTVGFFSLLYRVVRNCLLNARYCCRPRKLTNLASSFESSKASGSCARYAITIVCKSLSSSLLPWSH